MAVTTVTGWGPTPDRPTGGGRGRGGAIDIKVNHVIHLIRYNSVPRLKIKIFPQIIIIIIFLYLIFPIFLLSLTP